jgi:hypothetical protein
MIFLLKTSSFRVSQIAQVGAPKISHPMKFELLPGAPRVKAIKVSSKDGFFAARLQLHLGSLQ